MNGAWLHWGRSRRIAGQIWCLMRCSYGSFIWLWRTPVQYLSYAGNTTLKWPNLYACWLWFWLAFCDRKDLTISMIFCDFAITIDCVICVNYFTFCRMSRVCRNWKRVASETTLWREVNLSTMSVQSPRTATDSAIGKLAASRLKVVKELSLDGWSELTDVGLKVRKKFNFLP